jgi:hypothetical protein
VANPKAKSMTFCFLTELKDCHTSTDGFIVCYLLFCVFTHTSCQKEKTAKKKKRKKNLIVYSSITCHVSMGGCNINSYISGLINWGGP